MTGSKILWFNWRCWLNPEMGGAEVFTHEVAKRWVSLGHDVTLFTSEFPGCKEEEVLDGVKIVRGGGRFSVYGQAKKAYLKRFKAEHFDTIIDEINTRPFFAQKFALNGEKVVALIHQLAREFWFYETPFPVSYLGYYFLENRWLKNYVDVPTVTVSESTRTDLISLGFKHVSVVHQGLNFEPLSDIPEKSSEPVVVYAGRLKRAKRPDHVVKAFKIVRKKLPNAKLWVLGDGPFKEKLERIAGSNVKFFGNLSNEDRRDLIAKSWILVNPGLREGWGLNIVEANALGVPCVAYDVHGLRDSVINNETGLLAESGNVEGLAEKVLTVLADSHKRQTLSFNALRYAKGFNWDKTAKEFIEKLELD